MTSLSTTNGVVAVASHDGSSRGTARCLVITQLLALVAVRAFSVGTLDKTVLDGNLGLTSSISFVRNVAGLTAATFLTVRVVADTLGDSSGLGADTILDVVTDVALPALVSEGFERLAVGFGSSGSGSAFQILVKVGS